MAKEKLRIVVIGGGAGGLCAALEAARAGARVTVVEMANRVGKKLLRTGNGRCNLSNENVAPSGYNRGEFAASVLRAYPCAAIRSYFGELGLLTVADGEGRIYPRSDTANSVLDVLRLGCARYGVRELCSTEVTLILPREDGSFLLRTRDGSALDADRIVVATGGGTSLLKSLGHPMAPFSPVLCPLKTEVAPIRGLSGLRIRCRVTLLRHDEPVASEDGEVLFRDYGVSGIVILNMSRYAREGDTLSLQLLPGQSAEDIEKMLSVRPFGGAELLTGIFHRRVGEAVLRLAGSSEPRAVARVIGDLRLMVLGPADVQNAQVTRGGASVEQFDPVTMESRLIPGLYAIGEALDVDGRCGGYNLHWAFASGITAGKEAAK